MPHNLPLKSVVCQPLKAFEHTLYWGNNKKDAENRPFIKKGHSMNGSATLAARLRTAREAAGYSQEELAKKIGIVQQSLQKMEAGIIRNPRKLPLIESILGLPSGYLLYGDDTNAPALPQPIVARCPILNWRQAIDWPDNRNEILKDSQVKSLAQQIILGADCYALKIINDSMMDNSKKHSFNEGSYIIIEPAKKHESGCLVVATDNSDELFFRRYIKEGNAEYLFAYNQNYNSIKINNKIKIRGVVIAHLDILV
jgi:SOS-response transcriptional repressor LexA